MNKIGAVILSGRNLKEGFRKRLVSLIYHESYITGVNKVTLMPAENKTNLGFVIDALLDSSIVDGNFIVTVGPEKELSDFVDVVHVVDQGKSLGDNIVIGNHFLDERGYSGDYILYVSGDIPLISGDGVDNFLTSCHARGYADAYIGVGSRKELCKFVKAKRIEQYGKIRKHQIPGKGYLNKFGVPLIDDCGVFYPNKTDDTFISSNTFLFHKGLLRSDLFNNVYHNIKFPWDIIALKRYASFSDIKALCQGKWSVSQAEQFVYSFYGYDVKLVGTRPEFMLDTDSWEDIERNSHLLNSLH